MVSKWRIRAADIDPAEAAAIATAIGAATAASVTAEAGTRAAADGVLTTAVGTAQATANAAGALAATKADDAATTAALNGKAATAHNHAAGDTTSGTFAIARIPTGATGTTVPLGNDARFSDARTPTAHKTSHAVGGSDVLTPADIGAAAAIIAALGPRHQPSHFGYKAWTAHPQIGAVGGGTALTFGRAFLTRFTIDAAAMAALAGGPLTSARFVVTTGSGTVTNGILNFYSAATPSSAPLIADVALGTLLQTTGVKDVTISWTPPGVGDYYALIAATVGSGTPTLSQGNQGSSNIVNAHLFADDRDSAGLSKATGITSSPNPLDRTTYSRQAPMWVALS